MQTRHAITVLGDRSQIERRWAQFVAERDDDTFNDATVRFEAAPGDRGTEIHVAVEAKGVVGKAVAKVTGGEDADSAAKDGLRHFKQIVETGEVVRSDGTPEGQSAGRQLAQRPAQPLEEATR